MTERPQLADPRRVASALTRRVVSDEHLPSDIREQLAQGEAERLLSQGKLLQSKPRCDVVRLDHPEGAMLLKRHTWGDAGRTLRMALRTPVARKCYEHGHWLLEQGIPTPRPLALVEDRIGPIGLRSYLLTRFHEGQSLFDLIRWAPPSVERCQHLARQVATIWQRLIELNVIHCDLKPENFIVDTRDQVWLIDLEKLRPGVDRPRLVSQHLEDVESFLHVRTWRHQQSAAEIFRRALLETPLIDWARISARATHPLLHQGFSREELELEFTVVIITNQASTRAAVELTRDSSRVLTDRVAVSDTAIPVAATPWMLLLRPGERINPDLARHLVEQLLTTPQAAAVEIPLLTRGATGNRRATNDPLSDSGLRAFHTRRCQPAFLSGKLRIAQPSGPILRLRDAIEVVSPPMAPSLPTRRAA